MRDLVALVALIALSVVPLRAQTLSGTLVEEGGAPIAVAAVYVLDAGGRQVRSLLSDDEGRFRVTLPQVGTYRLRVERIGFETEEVGGIDVLDEGTWEARLPLPVRPLRLDPLQVRPERVCRAERNRNPDLIRVWTEARKALAQTALAGADSSRTFRVEVSERTLDADLRLLRNSADTLSLQGSRAFTFQGIEELGPDGWGYRRSDDVTDLYGPSPEAFLSARFGATHCLGLGATPGDGGPIGLDFESIADSLAIGLRGTFWIDPLTWRLERIDFRYTGTDLLGSAPHQGGTVVLDVDDRGVWYAAAWSIRGPVAELDGARRHPTDVGSVRRPAHRLTGYVENAGRVVAPREVAVTVTSPWVTPEALAAVQPDVDRRAALAVGEAIRAACGTAPDAGLPAVVAGTVTDSLSGVPLPQARVRMEWQARGDTVPRAAEARADERGYFQFCDAPAGEQVVLIATLRAPSAPVSLDVEPNMLHVQHLHLALSDPTQPGLLMGRVIDAESRHPVANAEVRLVGSEGARTLTNSAGYFSLGTHPWGVYNVSVSALGYMERDAPVRIQGGMAEAVDIRISTQPIPIEGVEVTVRGRIGRHTMEDMIRRMRLGFGSFVTRDLIERRPSARVVDLLREAPGVSVRFNGPVPLLEVRGRSCNPDVYVDGVYWAYASDYALTSLSSSDLEAIEIYKGFAEVPGQFMRMGGPPCAVIVIWTR